MKLLIKIFFSFSETSKSIMDIQEICDFLLFKNLVENEHLKTAKILKDERKRNYTLEFRKNEEIVQLQFHSEPPPSIQQVTVISRVS